MKIRYFSDIHCEGRNGFEFESLPTDKDTVLIIAGDFAPLSEYEYLDRQFDQMAKQFKEVFLIYGNHEYYHSDILDYPYEGATKVYPDEKVVIIGRTLWSDFNNGNPVVMETCRNRINDFHYIMKGNRILSSKDVLEIHKREKESLFKDVVEYKSKGYKVVVVTHHTPSRLSTPERYIGDDVNYYYCNDLDKQIIETAPDIWIHGHTHHCEDYMIGNTRVLANQVGYRHQDTGYDRIALLEV